MNARAASVRGWIVLSVTTELAFNAILVFWACHLHGLRLAANILGLNYFLSMILRVTVLVFGYLLLSRITHKGSITNYVLWLLLLATFSLYSAYGLWREQVYPVVGFVAILGGSSAAVLAALSYRALNEKRVHHLLIGLILAMLIVLAWLRVHGNMENSTFFYFFALILGVNDLNIALLLVLLDSSLSRGNVEKSG